MLGSKRRGGKGGQDRRALQEGRTISHRCFTRAVTQITHAHTCTARADERGTGTPGARLSSSRPLGARSARRQPAPRGPSGGEKERRERARTAPPAQPARPPAAGGHSAGESAGRGGSPSRDGAAPREEGGGSGSTFLLPPELFPLVAGVHGAVAGGGFRLQVPQAHGGVEDAEPQRQQPPHAHAARQLRARPPPGSARRPSAGSRLALTRHPRSARPPPRRPLAPAAAAQQPPPPPAAAGPGAAGPGGARRRRRGGKRHRDRDWDGGVPSAASARVGRRRPRRGRWGPARHGRPRGGAAPALLPGCRAAPSAPLLRRAGRVATRRRRDPDRGGRRDRGLRDPARHGTAGASGRAGRAAGAGRSCA